MGLPDEFLLAQRTYLMKPKLKSDGYTFNVKVTQPVPHTQHIFWENNAIG